MNARGTLPDGQAIDWQAIEATPEFQELVHKRRSFVIPCTIFFLSWYMGFILLAGYAPDFMGERVYEGLTVGYCLALTQFLMVGTLGIMYLRRAEKLYDPLAHRAIERFMTDEERAAAVAAAKPGGNGRGRRGGTPTNPAGVK